MGGYVAFFPYIPGFDLTTLLRGDSIAFGKSTSQSIYSKQHTPKIGYKLHKYGLKHALHSLDDHFYVITISKK